MWNRYLNFESHHAPQHKISVVKALYNRAELLPNSNDHKKEEKDHLFNVLKSNGYPKNFIHHHKTAKKKPEREDDESKGFAILPYVKGATEKIQRVLSAFNIKSAAKPTTTLRDILSKPKDIVQQDQRTGIIYKIPCDDCNVVYIGERGRSFSTRKKEHMACVRLDKTEKSALADHANRTGHNIAWEESSILATEPHCIQRRWLEAVHITGNKNCLFNKNNGRELPDNYRDLLGKLTFKLNFSLLYKSLCHLYLG